MCWASFVLPHKLYQLNKFHPFSWVGGGGGGLPLRIRLPQTLLEVLGLQVHVAPLNIPPQQAYFHLHIRLRHFQFLELGAGEV